MVKASFFGIEKVQRASLVDIRQHLPVHGLKIEWILVKSSDGQRI